MQSADRVYTSGVKASVLDLHFSSEQQKNHQQISPLKRYPHRHLSSHSSPNLHLSPSSAPVPLQAEQEMFLYQSRVILTGVGGHYNLQIVFATSKGLALAVCQH